MSSIIVLNPLILGTFAADGPGAKADITGWVVAVAFVAFFAVGPIRTLLGGS